MNAQELHDRLEYEHRAGLRWLFSSDSKERETILRALRLLAAAESNDGTTPETDTLMDSLADEDNAIPLEKAGEIEVHARRLERERNGLAARVVELEKDAERIAWIQMVAAMAESENQDEVNEADEVGNQLREKFIVNGHNLRAAIDAARSKP